MADGRRIPLEMVCGVLVDIDGREVWVEAFPLDGLPEGDRPPLGGKGLGSEPPGHLLYVGYGRG